MSSPIVPAPGPLGPPPSIQDRPASPGVAASTGIGDVGSFIAQLAAGVSALSIASSPEGEAGRNPAAGPPPEVLDQIAAAGRIGEQLRDAGHELRFFTPSDGGRVTIEVHDRDGNSVGRISPAAALELAAGSPLN